MKTEHAEHTPGPWWWQDEDGNVFDGPDWEPMGDFGELEGQPETLRGSGGAHVMRLQADIADGRVYHILTIRRADADLIAAAPDLLDACRLMLVEHERISHQMVTGDTPGMMAARAAIAKATEPQGKDQTR